MQIPKFFCVTTKRSMAHVNIIEQGRGIEWLNSFILLGFSLVLAIPGNTLTSTKGFEAFIVVGLDEASISTSLAIVAFLRIAALHRNGNWRKSPILRMIGAMMGSVLFSMLSMAFLWPTLAYGNAVSTGTAVYFILAFFDALSAYRSGADVRMVQQLHARHG